MHGHQRALQGISTHTVGKDFTHRVIFVLQFSTEEIILCSSGQEARSHDRYLPLA